MTDSKFIEKSQEKHEVVVTEAMIEAGRVVAQYHRLGNSIDDLVNDIYVAMNSKEASF